MKHTVHNLKFLKIIFDYLLMLCLFLLLTQDTQALTSTKLDDVKPKPENSSIFYLAQGSQINIKAPFASKVWLENKNIIKVNPLNHNWNVKALKPGHTFLKIRDKSYEFYILKNTDFENFEKLKNKIANYPSMHLEWNGSQTIVKGDLLRFKDWEDLAQDCQLITCNYVFAARIEPYLLEQIYQHFNKVFLSKGIPPLKIIFQPEAQLFLNPDEILIHQIHQIVQKYGIQTIKLKEKIKEAPMVQIKIKVIEVKKSFLRNLGIQWPEVASVSLNQKANTEELWANIHGFETNGDASLLASPNILCKSQEEAEFVAGGEFPIKIINGKIHDVIWKKYGILVKFKPIADFSGRMNIKMETEISQIDGNITVDGIPGLSTHKIKSEFDLYDSQTIMLSGLIRSDQSKSAEGIPFLKEIPIIGHLFKSQLFKNNESELIVLVRPEIQNKFMNQKKL